MVRAQPRAQILVCMVIQVLISVGVSLLLTMLAMGIAEALRRRFGWDPVNAIGGFLSRRDAQGQPLTAGAQLPAAG